VHGFLDFLEPASETETADQKTLPRKFHGFAESMTRKSEVQMLHSEPQSQPGTDQSRLLSPERNGQLERYRRRIRLHKSEAIHRNRPNAFEKGRMSAS
jgi:hypothetical protein